MSPYKALDAKVTGLPWNTGGVHTAKCTSCERRNEEMFRRCRDCSYLKCTDCFNREGMSHRGFCKLGSGPYPTLAQEQEILARHGGKAPARPAEYSEPAEHSGWQEVKQADTADAVPITFTPNREVRSSGPSPSSGATYGSSTVADSNSISPASVVGVPILNPRRDWRTPKKQKRKAPATASPPTPASPTPALPPIASPLGAGRRAKKQAIRRLVASSQADIDMDGSDEERPARPSDSPITLSNGPYTPSVASLAPSEPPATPPQRDPLRKEGLYGGSLHSGTTSAPWSMGSGYSEVNRMGPSIHTSTNIKQSTKGEVAACGVVTLDVRNIDTLRFTLAEGFFVRTGPSGQNAVMPVQMFYQYLGEKRGILHQEYVLHMDDAKNPREKLIGYRTIATEGLFQGREMNDKQMSTFQSGITSVKMRDRQMEDTNSPSLARPSSTRAMETGSPTVGLGPRHRMSNPATSRASPNTFTSPNQAPTTPYTPTVASYSSGHPRSITTHLDPTPSAFNIFTANAALATRRRHNNGSDGNESDYLPDADEQEYSGV